MTKDFVKNAAIQSAALRRRFMDHERFDELELHFTLLLAKRLSDIEAGLAEDAAGIALSAPSGSGKTRAIRKLVKTESEQLQKEGQGEKSLLYLRTPSSVTLKSLGADLLSELGYKLNTNRTSSYIWELVRHHLKENRTTFIFLDEAQELTSHGTKYELQSVASKLKTLMNDPEWPVGLILSGTPALEMLLNHDEQLGRRLESISFENLTSAADAGDIVDLIASYGEISQLSLHSDTQCLAMGERLIHAAAYQYGLVIEITIAAIERATLECSSELKRAHFAKAFHWRTACLDVENPFVVPDFLRTNPRQVFPGGAK